MAPVRSLYICYFGLREPLVQTQVLPYLRELTARGVAMSLLTFEPERFDETEWRERLRRDGITWSTLRYHKRPTLPATLYDVVRGAFRAASIARREQIQILHGRSHVGAAIGALAKRMCRARLIFDFRGLLAEEYVDHGNWRAGGVLYRLTKRVERWLLRDAGGVVFLTEAMRCERRTGFSPSMGGLKPALRVEVIPCCVDVDRFAAATREDLGAGNRVVYVYSGAIGGYYLIDEIARLLRADPHAFALILTRSAPGPVIEALQRAGFSPAEFRVVSAKPEDVPRYLRAADVGVSLIRQSAARRASSPTKFAEYLAAGLPVIHSAGVGDLDAQVEAHRVGVLVRSLDAASYAEAIHTMAELRRDPELPARCRTLARDEYDLHDVGGVRYLRLYDAVLRA